MAKFQQKNRILVANSWKLFEKQKTAWQWNGVTWGLFYLCIEFFYLFFFFFDFLGILGHLRPRKYMKSWWKRCLVSNKKVLTLGDIGLWPGHYVRCYEKIWHLVGDWTGHWGFEETLDLDIVRDVVRICHGLLPHQVNLFWWNQQLKMWFIDKI